MQGKYSGHEGGSDGRGGEEGSSDGSEWGSNACEEKDRKRPRPFEQQQQQSSRSRMSRNSMMEGIDGCDGCDGVAKQQGTAWALAIDLGTNSVRVNLVNKVENLCKRQLCVCMCVAVAIACAKAGARQCCPQMSCRNYRNIYFFFEELATSLTLPLIVCSKATRCTASRAFEVSTWMQVPRPSRRPST